MFDILVSIVVSYVVAKFTMKNSFDKIDGYVKEMIAELRNTLDELTDFQ